MDQPPQMPMTSGGDQSLPEQPGQHDDAINEMAAHLAQNPPQDEQDRQIIDGLAQSELQGRIQNASETYNMAADLDKTDPEQLREIGNEAWLGFEDDDKSRSDWLEQHTHWLALYMQQDYADNADPERSWGATESIPILTEACDQFQSRTYKIFFPNDTFVSAEPMRRTADNRAQLEQRADRIGKHMSYQLGYQDRTYRMDKDALFLGVAVHGSFFTKTYFDQDLRRFKVDNVRPSDLVINYHVGPCRIEDLRRKSHIIYTTVGATEELAASGYFIEPCKPSTLSIDKNSYNIRVDEIQGISGEAPRIKRDAPAVCIEQHTYLDLEGDGSYKPYIITICAVSHKVLRLTIGWEADPMGQPKDDYRQVQYFTHYKYKENPDGFYGLGLGHTIGDLNSACNILLRQAMDAATLANDGNMSGFVADRLGLEGDEIRMVLGRYRKIPNSVGDIQNAIYTHKFPGPNAALLQLMESMDQRAQRLGATTEATTGTLDKVVQPTTVINQIEQALEQFSSVQMRLSNSLSDELMKIYKINQKYLPLVDYYVVEGEPEAITRQDYADDMLIMPVFDPKYATQAQKVQRAQAELQATMQNPVNQGRPQVYDEAFRRYFEALQVENIDALIPPQPQPENLDDQYIENMFFLQPKESRPLFDVFPEQNHSEHLQKMQELFAVLPQLGVQLQPDQQEDLLKHMQKHQGFLYGQLHGLIPPPPPQGIPGQPGPQQPASSQAGSDVPMGSQPVTSAISSQQAQLLATLLGRSSPVGGPPNGAGSPPQSA